MERETCDELMPLERKREKRRRAAGDTGWKRRKEVSSNNARAGRGARSETKNRNGEYLPGTAGLFFLWSRTHDLLSMGPTHDLLRALVL
jgi:hypothetical protein